MDQTSCFLPNQLSTVAYPSSGSLRGSQTGVFHTAFQQRTFELQMLAIQSGTFCRLSMCFTAELDALPHPTKNKNVKNYV